MEKLTEMMRTPLSFHFFYVTLKAEEILYISKKKSEMENREFGNYCRPFQGKRSCICSEWPENLKHTNRKLLEGKVVATLFLNRLRGHG